MCLCKIKKRCPLRPQDLVIALTAASAVTSLSLPVLEDQQLMEQLAYVEKQKAMPNANEVRCAVVDMGTCA